MKPKPVAKMEIAYQTMPGPLRYCSVRSLGADFACSSRCRSFGANPIVVGIMGLLSRAPSGEGFGAALRLKGTGRTALRSIEEYLFTLGWSSEKC